MAILNNLIGQKFGRLTVIERAPNKNKKVYWSCQCDCGTFVKVRADQLTRGVTKSCGCLHKETASKQGKANFKDLTNQRFGKLTALYPIKQPNNNKYFWVCQCECGNLITVIGTSLTSGNTQSCGCTKSIGEANIVKILTQKQIEFKRQYFIQQNDKKYFYDFGIFDANGKLVRLIEFDGIQHFGRISGWFTEERKQQLIESDYVKNEYAIQHNIPLVRIPYQERDNITLEMILGDQYLITQEVETE